MARKRTLNELGIRPEPLPETNSDLFQGKGATLKHRIDAHFMNGLYERVKPFIEAWDDKDAVEGKVTWDRARAAAEARQYFKEQQDSFCADKTIKELDKALNWCLNQHQIGRNQRINKAIEQATKPPEGTA